MRSLDLTSSLVDLGEGRATPLLELVDAWAGHVLRLFHEARADVDPRNAWGLHDFVAALHIRDRVQQGLDQLPDDPQPPATVQAVDELFLSFTANVVGRLVAAVRDLPDQPWWWDRVPVGGPVITDLAEIELARRMREST